MRATHPLQRLRRTASAAGPAMILIALMSIGSPAAFATPSAVAEPIPPTETSTPEEPAAPAEPAAPEEPAAPQLSITVSDSTEAAAPGDELTYTITVANLGTSDVFDLTVTQSVPQGLEFTAADNDGTLTSSTVAWTVQLKAAETATLSTTMIAGDTPEELLRLATVACALSAPTGPPVVCASDSDILPAGVAAEKAAAAPAAADDQGTVWIIAASAAAALLIAAAAFLLQRRRKSSHRPE